MDKIIRIALFCAFLTGCGDDPFSDYSPIKESDYAQIRIEMDRCAHIIDEGSFWAIFRWAPKTDCLKHLKTRIVPDKESSHKSILFNEVFHG